MNKDKLTVRRSSGIVRILGSAEWRVQSAEGGCYVGICDSLGITLQEDTWTDLMDEITTATNYLFSELFSEGELDKFLEERGWTKQGQPKPNSAFDIPTYVLPMFKQRQLIKSVRELGYEHKGQTDRSVVYKARGGTHRIFIPRKQMVAESYVRSLLKQIGLNGNEIEERVKALSDGTEQP